MVTASGFKTDHTTGTLIGYGLFGSQIKESAESLGDQLGGGLSEHLAWRSVMRRNQELPAPRVDVRVTDWAEEDYPRAAYYLIISRDGDLQQQSSEP